MGPAADQYSLGIVGYEMITGQLPFAAESSLGMMYAQVHSPPRPSDSLRPDCPSDLREAIMRMLEKAPADRFPTLKEAVQTLSGNRSAIRSSGEFNDRDESVRSHIGLLAVNRPGRPVGESRRTPASPTPLSRIPPNSRVVARQRRVQFGQVFIGLFLAALGAGVVLVSLRDRLESVFVRGAVAPSPPAPSPADIKADSTLLVTRGATEYARERAVAAAVPPAALAGGDSLRAIAESLAAAGLKNEAALALQRAATIYGAAERAGQAAGQQAQVPPVPVRPGQTRPNNPTGTPPTGTPGGTAVQSFPTSDSVAIVQFYQELEQAVESRQLNEVQQLLPNMSDEEKRGWRDFFVEEDIRSIDASYQVLKVTRQNEVVFARVREEVTVHRVSGKSSRKRDNMLWTQLTYGPQGWRQIRASKATQ